MLSDWRNYETWEEAGPELPSKANRIWKELLAAYEPPPMDPAIAEELDAFVDAASPRAASRPTDSTDRASIEWKTRDTPRSSSSVAASSGPACCTT